MHLCKWVDLRWVSISILIKLISLSFVCLKNKTHCFGKKGKMVNFCIWKMKYEQIWQFQNQNKRQIKLKRDQNLWRFYFCYKKKYEYSILLVWLLSYMLLFTVYGAVREFALLSSLYTYTVDFWFFVYFFVTFFWAALNFPIFARNFII